MATDQSAFLKGVHFFCDHRCWRCPLANRCEVFARVTEDPPPVRVTGPAGRVAAVVLASVRVTVEQTTELLRGASIDPLVAGLPSDKEIEVAEERRNAQVLADPLVARGKEYAEAALRVLRALRPRLKRIKDAEALDACDRLEETCLTVASKVFRAVSSRLSDPEAVDEPQDDATGSAKVALLLIDESRQAWQLLSAPGRSFGNGAPRRFVVMLEVLEAGLLDRFPNAFSFVRPGFDTGDADRETTLMARALLSTTRPGNA